MADDDTDIQMNEALDVLQSMIDISADRLEGLRTQCATSAELTQQEIRTLEGKLIKLFSKQLVRKSRSDLESLPSELRDLPKLSQWLQVVGLGEEAINGIMLKVPTLEALQEKSEHELRTILLENSAREEEVIRLVRALHNLRRYTDILLKGDAGSDVNDMSLYWDSWDRDRGNNDPPRSPSPKSNRCSISSEETLPLIDNNHNNNNVIDNLEVTPTDPTSPTPVNNSPTHEQSSIPSPKRRVSDEKVEIRSEKSKSPISPPPPIVNEIEQITPVVSPTFPPELCLMMTGSCESRLSNSEIDQLGNGDGYQISAGTRLPTEPGANSGSDLDSSSPLVSSPVISPPSNSTIYDSDDSSYKSLQVPRSPLTPTFPRPGVMGHTIAHRFTKTFKVMTTCDYCEKQMFGTELKCRECKYKCHRECESKVPPSCQLPRELLDEFIQASNSPNLGRTSLSSPKHRVASRYSNCSRNSSHLQTSSITSPFLGPDSSSTSSCNSSTPSSPALVIPSLTPQSQGKPQFLYPDVVNHPDRGVTLQTHPLAPPILDEIIDKCKSQDSDKTISVSGSGSLSTDSERTPMRVDSQDSQVSDGEPDRGWPRQNSLSIREWDIPFDELRIGDLVGAGRFGTVYRGNWHGDVAIKVLNMDYLDDEKRLDAFKSEVSTFRKTRHENLVLFMGACMNPQHFAIVTSFSKGMTLYTHIHLRKDKFNMNKATIIAQQISQGMGYLHAKGIVHKDLKSKNIFLENGKVVITDFGLFGVTKLCYRNSEEADVLIIPGGWLCYLSPEIIRSLRSFYQPGEDLPFSKASDIYSFGTVWYELLCGEWPFRGQPPEAIIWQVGRGMKQSLANLQASRDVKDILMTCWSYRLYDRPDFTELLKTLEKLPKKRLARSPSHPIHLSRSAESVF